MILITGATGNNGTEIIRRLAGSGARVRAMVRKYPDGTDALPGVEYVMADFDDHVSIRRALDSVHRAFLTTNSTERVEAQQLNFVEQARAAGVRHIVYLSQLHAARSSPVRFLRYHAVVEDAIGSSGMAFTHLRPNLYMQGLLGFRSSIATEGRFFASAGDASVSIVDVRDIAAVAAAALTQGGARKQGVRYYRAGSFDTCRDGVRLHNGVRKTPRIACRFARSRDARRPAWFRLSRVAGRWSYRRLCALSKRRSISSFNCRTGRNWSATEFVSTIRPGLQARVSTVTLCATRFGAGCVHLEKSRPSKFGLPDLQTAKPQCRHHSDDSASRRHLPAKSKLARLAYLERRSFSRSGRTCLLLVVTTPMRGCQRQ